MGFCFDARPRCCKCEDVDAGLQGISKKRSCTDVLFLIGMVISWALAIWIVARTPEYGGNPDKILRGVDMYGRICGVSDGVEDRPLAVWPNPFQYKAKYCVADCSYTDASDSAHMAYKYESEQFAFYCLPTVNFSVSVDVTVEGDWADDFDNASEIISQSVSDLYTARNVIIICAALTIVITLMFVILLRYIAGCVIWACLVFLIFGGMLMGITLIRASEDVASGDAFAQRASIMKWMGYTIFIFVGIVVLVVAFMHHSIRIAIEVVREASHAVHDMKSTLLYPIFPIMWVVAFFVYWIWSGLWIMSVSKSTPGFETPDSVLIYQNDGMAGPKGTANANPATFSRFVIDDEFRKFGFYHVFHMLWQVQFIFYFGYMVVAGAVANWYFTPRDASGLKPRGDGEGELAKRPVLNSCGRTCRYHLGTVAFASLIIAVIKFVRFCVHYVERKMKSTQGEPNRIQKAVLSMISCCLKLAECCLDRISKNALIWTSIWGDHFLTAACSSFSLIWRNLSRVAALTVVSNVLLTVGKITVACLAMALCGFTLTSVDAYSEEITSPIVPCLVVFIIAYVICSLFMLVFGTTIDTTFLCFLVDIEANAGGKMLASDTLQELVGRHREESEQKAEIMQKDTGHVDDSVEMGEM